MLTAKKPQRKYTLKIVANLNLSSTKTNNLYLFSLKTKFGVCNEEANKNGVCIEIVSATTVKGDPENMQ